MNNFNQQFPPNNYNQGNNTANQGNVTGVMAKTFMANVFAWMFGALMITAITAYLFGTMDSLLQLLIVEKANGRLGMSTLGWVVMLAPLGLVLLMSLGYQKLSRPVLAAVFILYSALLGMSLSFIFLTYTAGSIYATFGIAAGMFGVMAVLGYTTNLDLTKFGAMLYMFLGGMVIAMIVNWFMHSETLYYLISFAGVAIFTGLTAYDVQKLKRIGMGMEHGSHEAGKLSIMGALTLYLDFINLFLFLLRLLGNRK
ncbi:MAG: hypothetical protein FD123_3798 [Bacteroidetes bacterium]|nr:MAG: hypothetical protein FD123_3798 [Bacteroidota bacterium]